MANPNLLSATERKRRERSGGASGGAKKKGDAKRRRGGGGRAGLLIGREEQTQAERSQLLMEGKVNDAAHRAERRFFQGISEQDTSRKFIDPHGFYLTLAPHPPKPVSLNHHLLNVNPHAKSPSSSSSSSSSSLLLPGGEDAASASSSAEQTAPKPKLNRRASEGVPVSKRRSVFDEQEAQSRHAPVPSSTSTTMDLPFAVRSGPLYRDDDDPRGSHHDRPDSHGTGSGGDGGGAEIPT